MPPLEPTLLDATYVKINPRLATPFPCKRCPDYALEGGLWKFSLNKGIFRIYYTMNGWRSLGSYSIDEDRIYLFNDPDVSADHGKWPFFDKDTLPLKALGVADEVHHHRFLLGGEGNDYFMVPRVMLAMKLFGLDKATIEEVCFQNPRDFFALPLE